MSVYDYIRRAIGIPPQNPRDPQDGIRPGFKNPIWGEDDDDDDELDEDFRGFSASTPFDFNFRIYSGDFIDIHRYFEKQMDDMLKSFGTFGFGDEQLKLPQVYKENLEENSVRSQYLKPSFERQLDKKSKKIDSDLDENFDASSFDLIPDGNRPPNHYGQTKSPLRFFGQSMSSHTITRPDGSLEHHKTVQKSDGRREVSITRQIAHQSHTMTTITNTDGTIETTQNFVNMDERELTDFNKKWSKPSKNLVPTERGFVDPMPEHGSLFTIFEKMFVK